MRLTAIIALTLFTGCNGKSNHVDDSPPPVTTPSIDAASKENPLPIDAQTAQWKNHSIDEIGLAFDMFADGEAPTTGSHRWRQQYGPVTLYVTWGTDATFERWRNNLSGIAEGVISDPISIQFCGHSARALTIETADRGIVSGKTRRGEGIHTRLAAAVHRATTFEHRGTPILVRWVVDLDARDTHRALEDHFFDSVTCHD